MTRTNKTLLVLIFAETLFSLFWFLFASTLDPILPTTYSLMRGEVSSYPALGYPALFVPAILLGISPTWWAFYIQLTLCLAGVWIFFREFDIEVHWGIALALVPFVAVMALEQTAAVPVFLVMVAVVLMRHRRVWAAALLVGLAVFFRTELILLFIPLALAGHWKPAIVSLFTVSAILAMLTGSVLSTNSPGVFYGSLGQLEGNPWGLTFADSCIERVAHEQGVRDPWSREGAELFTRLSYEAVSTHPAWYVGKVVKNTLRVAFTGPYIGEWRKLSGDWAWYVKIALHIAFAGLMFWNMLLMGAIRDSDAGRFVFWMVLVMMLAQGIGNQMVRHSNVFYLPLCALVFEWKHRRNASELAAYLNE